MIDEPNQSVDLRGLDIIQLLDGILDLPFVRPDINNKDEGVMLLNFLHRRFSI